MLSAWGCTFQLSPLRPSQAGSLQDLILGAATYKGTKTLICYVSFTISELSAWGVYCRA
jgi:hypothetical protein